MKNNKMYGYIYLTINLENGKYYIGQHRSIRFDHRYKGSGKILQKAFLKYGKNRFEIAMLESVNTRKNIWDAQKELDNLEIKYISKFKSEGKKLYNIARGGKTGTPPKGTPEFIIYADKISKANKGKIVSEETRKKLSIALKGEKSYSYGRRGKNAIRYGSKQSDEAKQKISLANTGKEAINKGVPMSDEQKEKLKISCKGMKNAIGVKHSEESKRKQSKLMKGRYSGKNNPMYGVHRFGKDSPHYGHHEPIKRNRKEA